MSPHARLQLLTGSGLCVLLVLAGRVYDLTVRRHVELRRKAERRRRRVEVLPARRAPIVDRRGRPLAVDQPVEDVALELPDLDPALQLVVPLAHALGLTRQEAVALLREARHPADALDPEAAEEGEIELGSVPLEDSDRAGRLLRRAEGLRGQIEPTGLRVFVSAALLRERDHTLTRLAELIEQPLPELEAQVDAAVDAIHAIDDRSERIVRWNRPVVLVEEASFEQVARVSERAFELPGVVIRRRYQRRYPYGPVAAHLTGALGLPTAEERERDRDLLLDGDPDSLGFLLGERTRVEPDFRLRDEPYGRTGLERAFDAHLRGTPGVRVLVRDSRNRVQDTLLEVPPRDGSPLQLTLDLDLQQTAEAALDKAVLEHGDPQAGGAAVVLDLNDGGILALASSPRFDPNTKRQPAVWQALLDDPRKPLLHRAVLSYAPASTFKILSAFALTDPQNPQAISPHWRTRCSGHLFDSDTRHFKCDGVHGETDLVRAIERSCNVFFFRGADTIGRDPSTGKLNPLQSLAALDRWAERVGLGHPVARGLYGERGGVIPSPEYKPRRAAALRRSTEAWATRLAEAGAAGDVAEVERARRHLVHAAFWYRNAQNDLIVRPGDVRNALIGQGNVQATPLQVATLAALVATGGEPPVPRIALSDPVERRHVALDPRVLDLVRRGMQRVVTHGTARRAHLPAGTAGKTGTGQRSKDQPYLAWFMGYYPASRPRLAFAVLVDRTPGHGGDVCAPVAGKLIRAWRELEAKR